MKTFSLREVADMALPPEWCDSERWLARRLNRREIRGYRVGRIWRMTEDHVEDFIDRFTNDAQQLRPQEDQIPETPMVDGLSRRSRRRLRTAS
jgi:hypothetical protein